MLPRIILSLIVTPCLFAALHAQPPDADKIDFDRARQLMQKMRQGEKLTEEERTYLERAKQAFQKQGRKPDAPGKSPVGLKPLTDMTAEEKYKGEEGGLYGNGKNEPPEKH